VWGGEAGPTMAAYKLVSAINGRLEVMGKTSSDRKAVDKAIDELQLQEEQYRNRKHVTLRRTYFRYKDAPAPVPRQAPQRKSRQAGARRLRRRRWMSVLQEWGRATKRHPASMSADEARKITDRLIAVAGRWRPHLDELFVHMERRIHWNGRQKIKWLLEAIDRLANNPLDWPIPASRRGRPDVWAGRIEDYLRQVGRAHKREIIAALNIPPTTAQTTLLSMERARRIERFAHGIYGLPTKRAVKYVPVSEAVLKMLATRGRTNAELIAGTGHSEAAIHSAIHRLSKAGKIICSARTRRGVPRGESYTTYGLRQ
jgi:hypothetical protein